MYTWNNLGQQYSQKMIICINLSVLINVLVLNMFVDVKY